MVFKGDKQHIIFIDPKGMQYLNAGLQKPKILLSKKIKEIEKELKVPHIILYSFIISMIQYSKVE